MSAATISALATGIVGIVTAVTSLVALFVHVKGNQK